jgi:tRNA(adenine34) deaminase
MNDIEAMNFAIEQAEIAFAKNEVPVGAVLLYDGVIIARAHNEVEMRQDASAHAEMLCLSRATQHLKKWRLQGAILYSTLEPCTMCAGAIMQHRLKKVVWGASDLRQGAYGSWIDVSKRIHPIHQVEVAGGVLADASTNLLKSFFQKRRMECPYTKDYLMK